MSCVTTDMIKGAMKAEDTYHIPASITLGQIVLESSGNCDGGLSGLAVEGKNLFGIKWTDGCGYDYIEMYTTEYQNGVKKKVLAKFKKYDSYQDSINDHAKLLCTSRYKNKTKDCQTIKEYCQAIQKAGYATDPSYADLLFNVIVQNDFEKYDNGKWTLGAVSNNTDTENNGGSNLKSTLFSNIVNVILMLSLLALIVYVALKAIN